MLKNILKEVGTLLGEFFLNLIHDSAFSVFKSESHVWDKVMASSIVISSFRQSSLSLVFFHLLCFIDILKLDPFVPHPRSVIYFNLIIWIIEG